MEPRTSYQPNCREWNTFQYERVGLNLRPELVAVKDLTGDAAKFTGTRQKDFGNEQVQFDPDERQARGPEGRSGGLSRGKPAALCGHQGQRGRHGRTRQRSELPLAVKADGLDELIALTDKLTQAGLKDLVLDSGSRAIKKVFEDQVAIRRAAFSRRRKRLWVFRPSAFPCEMAPDLDMETLHRGHDGRQVCRDRGLVRFRRRDRLSPSAGTAEHLHRSAAAHDGDPGDLRDQRPGREFTGLHHHQFLPDLLHRLRAKSKAAGCPPGSASWTPKACRS